MSARLVPPFRRRGVTLLEVVLSMGLLILLSSMTYWFYSSSLETRERGTLDAHKLRLMRVTMDRIRQEIRQAGAITPHNRIGIRGEAERILLTTLRVPGRAQARELRPGDEPPPAEYDVVTIEYKIARHPDIQHEDGYELPIGLARIEQRIPRRIVSPLGETRREERATAGSEERRHPADEALLQDAATGELEEEGETRLGPEINWEELYAPAIHYLRFCYFDGHTWWDSWDIRAENPLPQLVMVTVGFEGGPPLGDEFGRNENVEFCECLNDDPSDCEPLASDRYSMTVRVPQSDPLFRSRINREAQAMIERLGAETDAGAPERDQEE